MRMAITIVCATLLGMAVTVAVIINYKLTWPVIRQYLAKRRYRRESAPHHECICCDHCGGCATKLESFIIGGKLVKICKDRATCQKTQVYQRMLRSMS
jgi:hypothetical protein